MNSTTPIPFSRQAWERNAPVYEIAAPAPPRLGAAHSPRANRLRGSRLQRKASLLREVVGGTGFQGHGGGHNSLDALRHLARGSPGEEEQEYGVDPPHERQGSLPGGQRVGLTGTGAGDDK